MSTPEQPETPPLTRKQLREIRNTGAIPTIDTTTMAVANPGSGGEDGTVAPAPFDPALHAVAPVARPAEPVTLPAAPGLDADIDLGVAPLTRRQAREQERIRTASVPVITPEIAAAYAAQAGPTADADDARVIAALSAASADHHELQLQERRGDGEPNAILVETEADEADADAGEQPADIAELVPGDEESLEKPAPDDHAQVAGSETDGEDSGRVVNPGFGAALLAGDAQAEASLPSSFDELITRSSNGSAATPNALILSQAPEGGPIVAPMSATGELLIIGSLALPEDLGSTGHAPGAADGKEVDAVLVDGELPAHSSPTPIAASAAISTPRTSGEIIQPPPPEKGGRLMLTLAVTAGVLALALVGVLILAFVTGVF